MTDAVLVSAAIGSIRTLSANGLMLTLAIFFSFKLIYILLGNAGRNYAISLKLTYCKTKMPACHYQAGI
jgi:hypothetical protein